MTLTGAAEFLKDLEQHQLLEPAQLQQLTSKMAGHIHDVRAVAKALVQRGWLTAYQAGFLVDGRAQELVLGTYTILDKLGEGGMGEVLKARHRKLDRVVALKIIRKERLASADAIKRFLREIQATAKLSHANVVVAHDPDEVDGTHYFAMEYVEGVDLAGGSEAYATVSFGHPLRHRLWAGTQDIWRYIIGDHHGPAETEAKAAQRQGPGPRLCVLSRSFW